MSQPFPESGFFLQSHDLILLAFLGAGQVEDHFHDPFSALGCCSEAVADFSDGLQEVAVEDIGDGRDVVSPECVDVTFFDDRGELEGDLFGVVGGSTSCWVSYRLVYRGVVGDK